MTIRKVIVVTGASGSGKTEFCKKMTERTRERTTCVVSADWCYKNPAEGEDPTHRDYDHPSAVDYELLVKGVEALRRGESFNFPVYDFATHRRVEGLYHCVGPADDIYVEGIMLLSVPEVREAGDILVYIDAEPVFSFIRRLRRDTNERGRTVDSVIEQYLTYVHPSYDRFIRPTKEYAHTVIVNMGKTPDEMFQQESFSKFEKLLIR
jgi:uridine kinase